MKPLTYRELQLIKSYRASDDRGRYAIEEMARHQAETCRPASQQQPKQSNVVQLHH